MGVRVCCVVCVSVTQSIYIYVFTYICIYCCVHLLYRHRVRSNGEEANPFVLAHAAECGIPSVVTHPTHEDMSLRDMDFLLEAHRCCGLH